MGKRNARLLLLAFSLIPLLSFPRALFSDRTLFLRDISLVWLPQVESVVRQIANGEFPFFDSRRAFGQPLFADPRAEVLYPPAWIHWLIPPAKSYSFFCAFHLVVAALGAARLARRMFPEMSRTGQMTAGLAYGASGPLLSLVSHWHHLAAAAWIPWIIEKCDPEPGSRTPWLPLASLVALQILAGSPDYVLTTFLLCALRLALRNDLGARSRLRLAFCLALGVLMSAVQALPSLSFARDAARETHPSGWAISPLHPALTIETVLPVRAEGWPLTKEAADAFFGGRPVWMFSHYLGLSVWLLAGLGLSASRGPNRWFCMGAITIGLVLSWGIRSDALQELVGRLPLVSGLRFPTKHLAAASLGLALLAARATAVGPPQGLGAWRGPVLGPLLAVIVFLSLHSWATGMLPDFARLLPLAGPLLIASAISVVARKSAERFLQLSPLVVALDLLGSQTRLNPTTPGSLFRERPPLTAVIPPNARLYVSDYSIALPRTSSITGIGGASQSATIRPPAGVPYRLRQIPAGYDLGESLVLAATWYLNPPVASRFGYLGSFDMDILDFYRGPLKRTIRDFVTSNDSRLLLDRLQRGSVDYVVTMDAPDLWQSLPLVSEERRFFEDPVRVYRVPEPWPRARFETVDGTRVCGRVDVLEMSDGRIRVEAECDAPARLVVAFAHDRGWRGFVDGKETPVSDNTMALLSVGWDGGRHIVEFRYRPPLIKIGGLLSILSLATLIALTIIDRRGTAPLLGRPN
jgi:hypothetical protein